MFFLLAICILPAVAAGQTVGTYTFSTTTGFALDPMPGSFSMLIGPGNDDAVSLTTAIGFELEFDGQYYSDFIANSNGLVTLGASNGISSGTNLLTNAAINPKLAPYWDDLATGTNGYVATWLSGMAPNRRRVIEWLVTVPKAVSGTAAAKFQLWIVEGTRQIRFVYSSGIGTNSAAYSVGMSGTSGTFHAVTTQTNTSSTSVVNDNNTNAMNSGRTYLFTPPSLPAGCVINTSPSNGDNGVIPATQLKWDRSYGSPTGYNVYFGTSPTPPLVASAQTSTTYNLPPLNPNTNYYWKVEPINALGTTTTCSVQSFRTGYLLTYTPAWTDNVTYNSIAGSGTPVSAWRNASNTDDNLSQAVPIGFSFVYQNVGYSSLLISTNGYITFNTATSAIGNGPGSYGYFNSNLTNGDPSNNSPLIIAPLYEDLVCQGNPGTTAGLSNSIRYSLAGSAPNRVFTVEWVGMEVFNNAGPNLNFQVRLYETTGEIEFVYGTMEAFNGTSAYNYSSSIGLNAAYISSTPVAGEYFAQQQTNSASFGFTPANSLNQLPRCNTMVRFTPGASSIVPVTAVLPPNDQVPNATEVFVNPYPCTELCGTYYSSQNATGSGPAACSGNADDDTWFRFMATNAQTTIRVAGGADYDPVFELWNDALNTRLYCRDTSGAGSTEQLSIANLTVGSNYYLRVFHKGSGSGFTGQFILCVYATPPAPSNDNCSSAILLNVNGSCITTVGTSTLAATASPGIPVCSVSGTTPDDDVWYSFKAINPVCYITVQGGSGFNPVVQLFSGTCGNLQAVQCANLTSTGQSETLTATGLTLGATYYVRVYHAASGAGSGLFSICVYSPAPSCTGGYVPANATQNIPSSGTVLRWNKAFNANAYTVYFDMVNPPVSILATVTDTFVSTGSLMLGAAYYWKAVPVNATGSASGCTPVVFATDPSGVSMRLKTFLQGYYLNGGLMAAAVGAGITDTIADTLIVSLANAAAPHQIISSSKGLLGTNGIATFDIPQPCFGLGSYYLVMNHRNHLETWSALPVQFNVEDSLYNLSDSPSRIYGGNVIQVAPGKWAMYAGDTNKDGIIESTDYSTIENGVTMFSFGYDTSDLTGDGLVEASDYSLVENNALLFLFSITP
jgi:hypothetical protein